MEKSAVVHLSTFTGQKQPPCTHLHWAYYTCRRDPNQMSHTHINLHITYTGSKVRFGCLESLCLQHEATHPMPAYSELRDIFAEVQKTGIVTARWRRVDSQALKCIKISVTYKGDHFLPCMMVKEQNRKRKEVSPVQSSCGYSKVSYHYILSTLQDYNVLRAIRSTKSICK